MTKNGLSITRLFHPRREFGTHGGEAVGLVWVSGEIILFVGIGLQVIKFLGQPDRVALHNRGSGGIGLSSASLVTTTPYGELDSSWKQSDGKVIWTMRIPANSYATAWIPTKSAGEVREGSLPLK